jgi:hypothetical protein
MVLGDNKWQTHEKTYTQSADETTRATIKIETHSHEHLAQVSSVQYVYAGVLV